MALPTFLLLLVTEDRNKQGLNGFWKTTKIFHFCVTSSFVGLGMSTITFSQRSFWVAEFKSVILQ